jgi:cell division protein FtsB
VLSSLKSYLPTAVLALLIFYFGFHAFTGDRGLLTEDQRKADLAARRLELAKLEAQRHDLEVRTQLLRDERLSADLLDERARFILGYADPRDYVIRVSR